MTIFSTLATYGPQVFTLASKVYQSPTAKKIGNSIWSTIGDKLSLSGKKVAEQAANTSGTQSVFGNLVNLAKEGIGSFSKNDILKQAETFFQSGPFKQLIDYGKKLFQKGENKTVKDFAKSLANNAEQIIGKVSKILGIDSSILTSVVDGIKKAV